MFFKFPIDTVCGLLYRLYIPVKKIEAHLIQWRQLFSAQTVKGGADRRIFAFASGYSLTRKARFPNLSVSLFNIAAG